MPPLSSIQMEPDKRSWSAIFLSSQLHSKPNLSPASTDLSGKVAIVTGGSTILGFVYYRDLLRLKLSYLIIAVRSPRKGEDARSKLLTECPNAKVEVWELEMGSYDSIQALVRRTKQLNRLDIAILNAGLTKGTWELNPITGHEETIQINYVSTMLLAILIPPVLKSKSPTGSPGRLTIVGSGTAYAAAFCSRNEIPLLASFDKQPKSFDTAAASERYWVSKLLGHIFTVNLASYVHPEDVVMNIVDPGLCKGSQLNREAGRVFKAVGKIITGPIGRTLDAGASTYLDAAVVKGEESHGSFIMDWEI
jgi:NAD(P)-dependent dehydrogenase (short-subunit alcohol dehydrogenase family)